MRISSLYSEARMAGRDRLVKSGLLHNPTVQKMLNSPKHGIAGGGGKELEQLEAGSRLVAWVEGRESTIRNICQSHGWQYIKHRAAYLIYRPENRDVANLLSKLSLTSPVGDVLRGLAFGYNDKAIDEWANDRERHTKIRKWLKLKKLGIQHFISWDDDKVYFPKELTPKLKAAGVKIDSVPSPVIQGHPTLIKYIAVDMADIIAAIG